jgi:Zn-dependent oligopeptidase
MQFLKIVMPAILGGANYYGYLWSPVFAQDIFSVFEKTA